MFYMLLHLNYGQNIIQQHGPSKYNNGMLGVQFECESTYVAFWVIEDFYHMTIINGYKLDETNKF